MLKLVQEMRADFVKKMESVKQIGTQLARWCDIGIDIRQNAAAWIDEGLRLKGTVETFVANIGEDVKRIDAEIARLKTERPEES